LANPKVTFDLTTDVGKVRLLIPDLDESGNHIYTDAELSAYYSLAGLNHYLAAALALECAGTNEALRLKVARALDLATDGAKLLDAIMGRAKQLRADAVANPQASTIADIAFGFAQVAITPSQRDEIEDYRQLTT